MSSSTDPIDQRYGVTASDVLEAVQPPFTPRERTRLVTDYLLWWQEAHPDHPVDGWETTLNAMLHADDPTLYTRRRPVDQWVLSRDSTPRCGQDAVAQALLAHADVSDPADAIATHQLFKRLRGPSHGVEPDYWFLTGREVTYYHMTDQPTNND